MTHTPRPEAPERIWLSINDEGFVTGSATDSGSPFCSHAYVRADALRPAASEGETLHSLGVLVDWSQPIETKEIPPRPATVVGETVGAIPYMVVTIGEHPKGARLTNSDYLAHPPGEYRACKKSGLIRGNLAVHNVAETTLTAASEGAGYSESPIDLIIRDVSELPDDTSPDDPQALIVTVDDLRVICERHLSAFASEEEGWEPSDADIIAVAKKYYRETWGRDWHTQHCTHTQSAIARSRQAFEFVLPQLSAAQENRVLREALKPFRPAYDAYVSTIQNFTIRGETLADQKASNREMIVTAEENAFQALATITFEHLRAVEAALSTAHPYAQASLPPHEIESTRIFGDTIEHWRIRVGALCRERDELRQRLDDAENADTQAYREAFDEMNDVLRQLHTTLRGPEWADEREEIDAALNKAETCK